MIMGVTGTRNLITERQRDWMREQVASIDELHHGACVGADKETHYEAIDAEINTIIIHPPTNGRLAMDLTPYIYRPEARIRLPKIVVLERKPYHDRNRDIVDDSDQLIALPDGPRRPHSGTWYTIDYAKSINKPVTICYPDGTLE